MSSGQWVDFRAVKERVCMQAVLGLYRIDGLKRSGPQQLRGRCPIHRRGGEGAFHVSLVKNAFQCFYCQAHGNVLDLVAALEQCSVRQAAVKLQERWGLSGGWRSAPSREGELVPEKRGENPPLGFVLWGVDPSHPYLAQRGMEPATAHTFGVGFFSGRGIMSGRVVIPIHDPRGRLVAYCGRSVDGTAPRYKLPVGFRKSLTLFNLHRAAACGEERVVVVEGFFDCMKIHQGGLPVRGGADGSYPVGAAGAMVAGAFPAGSAAARRRPGGPQGQRGDRHPTGGPVFCQGAGSAPR